MKRADAATAFLFEAFAFSRAEALARAIEAHSQARRAEQGQGTDASPEDSEYLYYRKGDLA